MGCKEAFSLRNPTGALGFNRNIMGCKVRPLNFRVAVDGDLIGT